MLQRGYTLKTRAMWKKPDTEVHMLCGPFYMKCPEQANPWGQNVPEWLLGAGVG